MTLLFSLSLIFMTSMAQSDEESPPNPVWNTRPTACTRFETTKLVLIVVGANLGSFIYSEMINKHKNPNTKKTPYDYCSFIHFFLIPFLLSLPFRRHHQGHHRRSWLNLSVPTAIISTSLSVMLSLNHQQPQLLSSSTKHIGSPMWGWWWGGIRFLHLYLTGVSLSLMTRLWWKRVSDEREKRTSAATRLDLNEIREMGHW